MTSLQRLMDMRGRKSLVTGAAGHIAQTAVEALKEMGADVVITDYREDRLREHMDRYGVEGLTCNLNDPEQTATLASNAAALLGGLDVVVHCAALTGQGIGLREGWVAPFAKQSVEAFEYSFRVQATSLFLLCREGQRFLEASGHGSVVVLGSIYGLVAPNNALYEGLDMAAPVGYSATKGAVHQMVRHLAVELSPRVRVNALTPGGLWREQAPEFIKRYEERVPLRRMGREDDLKGAIAFLVSDMSGYMTGANLVVDGGWTVW